MTANAAKKRKLTEVQITVINMIEAGFTYKRIGEALGINENTARQKHKAIILGIKKGAYCNLPPKMNDLFTKEQLNDGQ